MLVGLSSIPLEIALLLGYRLVIVELRIADSLVALRPSDIHSLPVKVRRIVEVSQDQSLRQKVAGKKTFARTALNSAAASKEFVAPNRRSREQLFNTQPCETKPN